MLKTNYKNKVWSRLTWLWMMTCCLFLYSSNMYAQCTNTSAYGTVTAPTAGGNAVIGCQYAGEYGTINSVVAGAYFKSSSTVATDYCTVRQGSSSGTVVAYGPQPLYWQATVAGTYFIHWNTNASCGLQSSCRDVTITSMVGCTNLSSYGTVTAPTNTTPATIFCNYAGEYGTINLVQAGKTYVSSSTIATDYITIHLGSASGPIVASGVTPLTWTSSTAGTYYQHVSLNAACGTESSCRDVSIYCNDCIPPCSGTPVPGNTISSSSSVCSGVNFNLSFQNTLVGANITYQWQSSTDNITYTNIPSATSSTLTTSQLAATYYQCLATCSGNTGTSNPIQVTMAGSAACLVYCVGSATCGSGDHITNVNFNSGAIANPSGVCLGSGGNSAYSDYRTSIAAPSVQAAGSYPISVSVNNGGTEFAAVWIDLDHSGTFDASEFMSIPLTLATTWNGSVIYSIPSTALSGETVLRVRSKYSTAITDVDACSAFSYGETEDYLINITPAMGCAGTPAPGNTIATVAQACPSANFTLSLQFPPVVTGITYDWQSSPDGVTYTSTGGTGQTFTTNQLSDTYYQCVITCTNSGLSATSTPLQVTMSPFYNCYCTSGLGGSCAINSISSVAVATTTLNNVTSGCTGTYNSFPATGSTTADIVPGVPYTMTVGCISGSNTQVAIWIDYNQNGIYEASEYTLINGNITSGGTGSGSFTVPVNATSGSTGLRVRSDWQGTTAWTAADACTNRTWGETEDYTINILIPGNCSGTPASSVTTASTTATCPGTTVIFGTSPSYTDAGLTFDWQSSTDGITYTSTGVTTQQYTLNGFSATAYYQCVVTCTNSGGSSTTSTPILVTLNPFYNCYCAITNQGGSCITNVTFNTLNHTTPGCENAPSYYTSVPIGTATTTVVQGATYTFSLTTDGGAIESVWIDYDQNGIYDASEWTQVTTSSGTGTPSTVSITVPITALTGNTGMRVRTRATGNQNGAGDACLAMGSGESQDYTITIAAAIACTGAPAASNTISDSPTACLGASFGLTLSAAYLNTGITFQWQSSPDGVSYSNISGATNQSYSASQSAATYYQCIVTCTNSGMSITSTPVQVTMSAFYNCYCNTNLGGVCGTQSINSVDVATTTLNNVTGGCTTPYTLFPASGSTTATLIQGASYNFTVGTGNNGNPAQVGVWIDANQNGLYEVSEYTLISSSSASGSTSTASVLVPISALTGNTGMRIRSDWASSAAFDGTNACSFLDYGETEDYVVTIAPAVTCSGTPGASVTTSTSTLVCPGINFTLNPSPLYTESGLTYDWQSSPDGVTYSSTGVTTQQYTLSQSSSTYYQLVVTCTNGGVPTTSTPLLVSTNSVSNCYCTAGATTVGCTSGDEYIGNVSLNTINNTSTCAVSGQYSDFTGITTSLQIGATYSAAVLIPNYFSSDMVSIWIDLNQDGLFNSTTEQFDLTGGGTSGSDPFTGNITIPGSALNGNTRMRVRVVYTSGGDLVSPCGVYTYGEVEDYTVNISPATCILAPTYPADGSNGCPNGTNITLSWPSLAGSTGYDVYFGSTTPPSNLVSSNQPGLTFNADVSAGGTFYWMVVPQIAGGGVSCNIWSFGLNAAPDPIAAGGGYVCFGTDIYFSSDNIASGQTTGNTYDWSGPGGFTSNQQNPFITGASLANNGTYTVIVTNQFLCTASATVDATVNPNPTLYVVSSQNVGCIGGSDGEVTVASSTGTAPFDFTYDFINFNQDGVFNGLPTGPTVYYVTDANGCFNQMTTSLTYISAAPPSANVIVPFIGMPTYVCNGTSAVLSIPAVVSATKYIWDAPTGAYFNGNPLNVSPFETTTPSVQVTYGNPIGSLYQTGVQAANACGTSLRKIQKSRGVVSTPAGILGVETVCSNTTSSYSTPPVDAATSYEWTITGDATVTGTGTTCNVTFGPAWNGGVLCVAAKTSCYKSAVKCMTLTTSATLSAISGSFTACPNSTLSYSVPVTSGAASYTWTLPPGATGTSTTNAISVSYGSGYNAVGNICVSLTSVCGVSTQQKCKTVAPGLPSQPSAIAGASSGICSQSIVYSCPAQGSGVTYNWTSPGTINSGQGSTSISSTFGVLSTGNVCVTASNTCGSSSARCIAVKGAPNSPGAVTATPSSWCANDAGIEFEVNTSALTGNYTLSWTYPSSPVATYVIGGGNSSSLILDWGTGTGSVNVIASNACGNGTRPSSWSSTCREGAVGSVSTLTVSPNPTTGVINVNYTATKGNTVLNVIDLAGRVIMAHHVASVDGANNAQLDMSKLAKGAYLLSVQSNQGSKQVRVVVE